jgi:hypothetical protein
MKWMAVLVAVVFVPLLGCCTPAARLGVQMADTHAQFAPLYGLYDAYAEYLFAGTPFDLPVGIQDVCVAYLQALEELQLALIQETLYDTAGVLSLLVRLRATAGAFCLRWGETLASLTEGDPVSSELADELAAQGFFASIREMNGLFEETLDEALGALGETGTKARWELGVAFSARALVDAPELESISPDIRAIFYGNENSDRPPFDVSLDVEESMALLVEMSGRELDPDEREIARTAALSICEGLTAEVSAEGQ